MARHAWLRRVTGAVSWRTLTQGLEISRLRVKLHQLQRELRDTRAREKQASYLAFHDDLTALPNRRFFLARLKYGLAAPRGFRPVLAVLYLDLDGFKALNDEHGHDTGDALLNLIASRLVHAVRAEDVVSRLGGDEYACLITGVTSRDHLRRIAVSLFDSVSAPFDIGSLRLTVRPSIGIAVYPKDGTTPAALLKSADAAMYQAKRLRSQPLFFDRGLGRG
jgi:diguanylate cyclase (GGDEF)-like protein